MGYLVTAHILKEQPDLDRLSQLPDSIGYRVYHHRSADVCMIDTFRSSRPAKYPFQTVLPAADLSLDLSEELGDLESVYNALYKLDLANSFKKSYINFGLLLNQLLSVPVFSFISDDDEWDFACTISQNAFTRLKCRCGDLIVTYESGTTLIDPLSPEIEDEEEFLTNLEELRAALPGIAISDRNTPWNAQLHAIAIEEWQRFSEQEQTILGLGSFDPPEDELDWVLIGGS